MRLVEKVRTYGDAVCRNSSEPFGPDNVVTIGGEIVGPEVLSSLPGLHISMHGTGNRIALSGSIHIAGALYIRIDGDRNTVDISDDVFFGNDVAIVFYKGGPDSVADECGVTIGRGTKFTGQCISLSLGEAKTNISVGSDCLIASRVKLVTSDNHGIFDFETSERLNPPGDVIVGDHCWLCEDVILLNNTEIPNGCVVGIRSVVTKKFADPNCMIAGVPSAVRRKNIKWSAATRNYLGNM
jgi:acetyltransferase-like isoleucine patch superfamily enzyme